jgi:hypothetical protein
VNVLAVRVLRLSPDTSSATSIMRTSKPGMILSCELGVGLAPGLFNPLRRIG